MRLLKRVSESLSARISDVETMNETFRKTLDTYLSEHRGQATDLAVRLGVGEQHMSDLRKGRRKPSAALLEKISNL